MAGNVVAYLEVVFAGSDPKDTQSDIEIRGSEQFYLGRNGVSCRQSWQDPVISNRHLRIHSIVYDQNPDSNIPPAVYATDISTNGTHIIKANAECASSQGKGTRMGRDATFLLDDGDKLQLSKSITLVYHSLTPVRGVALTSIQQREKQLFSSRYLVTNRVLGEGGYGKVMVAIRQDSQLQVACKVIDLRRFSSSRPTSTRSHSKYFREFDVLKDLSHPNIIAIEKVFWSSNTIYIVQDLITGGDLFSYVEHKGGRLNDIETAVIIRQVLKGIQYLHDRDIVHRDLKPDNILMTGLDDGARIVITDFGHARHLPPDEVLPGIQPTERRRMYSHAGTLEYAAPEIHRKNKTIPADSGYSKAVDMWSIGIITGTLLSGVTFWVVQNPVHSEVNLRASVLELSSRCDLAFLDDRRDRIWRNVGSKPKDFMKRLVILKEQCRMTATQALTHPWFTNNCHVATFDAVYENSVRDWRPRGPVDLLVESISQLSSELPDSVISNKFLTQEVVSRYFAPPRESSSSGKYDSSGSRPDLALVSRLSSIEEEGDAPYTPSRERSSPPSYNPDEGVRYHEQNGKLSASIGTLSVAIDGKYTRNKATTKQDEPLVARSSDVINAGIDSIYPFSIPDGPPHSPELRREFVLIPETPIRHVKRRREQQASRTLGTSREPQGDAEKAVKRQKTCYFARLPSKRAKLHH